MTGFRPAEMVDTERLWHRLMRLADFGSTPAGGVNRQALSHEEIAARRVLCAWAEEEGLPAFNDPIGNLFFRLEGEDADAPPVLCGSHIDSQPTGGRFDGTFGVLAAIEVLGACTRAGRKPRRAIEAVAWTNEEGSRFAPGMMGSGGFTGQRALSEMLAVRDADGTSVATALCDVLDAEPTVVRRPLGFPVHSYIEAHIEQGPVLEREGKAIGVVTGIQGSRRFRVRVTGEAGHAGTTPRADRRDAVLAAIAMIDSLTRITAEPEDVMFTVGMIRVEPNAPSVIAREVLFSIDVRHPDNAVLAHIGDAIPGCCEAARGPCDVAVSEIARAPSLEFPTVLMNIIAGAAERLGLGWCALPSAAGHDSRQLHYHCPSGMIFVPCRGGISHSETEWTDPTEVAAGCRVLAETLWELANAP